MVQYRQNLGLIQHRPKVSLGFNTTSSEAELSAE